MYALNDGQAEIFRPDTRRDEMGAPVYKLGERLGSFWFEYIGIHSEEYYETCKTGVTLVNRIRILRRNTVSGGMIVVINGEQFRVGKVFHGRNKSGIPVTDITLERLDYIYEAE